MDVPSSSVSARHEYWLLEVLDHLLDGHENKVRIETMETQHSGSGFVLKLSDVPHQPEKSGPFKFQPTMT